ncbi:MAG: hypothetical protein IT181_25545 [Acidobacteria bacterium]|nr:hypothetical protein [Acidobacteriota bacterium]
MDLTVSTWIWVACLGGAGGAVSAWLARQRGPRLALSRLGPGTGRAALMGRLGAIGTAATIAAATAAATAWMIGRTTTSEALAFFWIGFVTAGWMAAERDKRLLRQAVCRAATAPAAHPDTVLALADASPDAVYEAVKALVPHRVVH